MKTSMNLLFRDSSTYLTGSRSGSATLAGLPPGFLTGGAGRTDQEGDQFKLRDPCQVIMELSAFLSWSSVQILAPVQLASTGRRDTMVVFSLEVEG